MSSRAEWCVGYRFARTVKRSAVRPHPNRLGYCEGRDAILPCELGTGRWTLRVLDGSYEVGAPPDIVIQSILTAILYGLITQ